MQYIEAAAANCLTINATVVGFCPKYLILQPKYAWSPRKKCLI